MAYQALYRKLRPSKFSEVFGQDNIVKTLKNQIKNNQIAHAYLFCGTRGTGKTSLAKIFANAVNCKNSHDCEPCGECPSCVSALQETHPDIFELDAASRNGVDDMRELLERVAYTPQLGQYKVYIIDEVHMLSTAAFNALLKTLEEPPEYIIFILATTEPQKIPATILSRCQKYDLSRISAALIYQKMKEALDKLGIQYEDSAVIDVAIAADGSVRDGWSILDICIAGLEQGDVLTSERIENMLGTSKKDFIFKFSENIIQNNYEALLCQISELLKNGKEPLQFVKQLAQHFRNLMMVKLSQDNIDDRIGAEEYKKLKSQGEYLGVVRLLNIIDMLMEAEMKMKWSATPSIALEHVAMRLAMPFVDTNYPYETLDAIKALSTQVEMSAKHAPMETLQKQGEKVAEVIEKVEDAKPKALLLADDDTKKIWRAVEKELRGSGMIRMVFNSSLLIKEDDGYVLTFYPDGVGGYNLLMDKPHFQQELALCIARLVGKEMDFTIRLMKKDHSHHDKKVAFDINALQERLPDGVLQVVK